jgi:hypothetical protein
MEVSGMAKDEKGFKGGSCLMVAGVFVIIGMDIALIWYGIQYAKDYWYFQRHESVPTLCRVIEHKKETIGGRNSRTEYYMSFRYAVNEVAYTATDTVSKEFYNRYPRGAEMECYVSSLTPRRAILQEHLDQLARSFQDPSMAGLLTVLAFNCLLAAFIATLLGIPQRVKH